MTMVCLLHGTFLCQGLGDNHMMVEAFGANSGMIPVGLVGGYQGIIMMIIVSWDYLQLYGDIMIIPVYPWYWDDIVICDDYTTQYTRIGFMDDHNPLHMGIQFFTKPVEWNDVWDGWKSHYEITTGGNPHKTESLESLLQSNFWAVCHLRFV